MLLSSFQSPAPAGSHRQERASIIHSLHRFLKEAAHDEFRRELARAEGAGELAEFYVLSFHAIVTMSEGSELASEYLEMAEAVAASPYELIVVTENWTTYDLLQDNPGAAAERCLSTLDHLYRNEHLWRDLLVALCRLGSIELIEATLRSLTDHDYRMRLTRSSPVPARLRECS
jgi:hypothetical protein